MNKFMEILLVITILLMLKSTKLTGFVQGVVNAIIMLIGVFFLFVFGIILLT